MEGWKNRKNYFTFIYIHQTLSFKHTSKRLNFKINLKTYLIASVLSPKKNLNVGENLSDSPIITGGARR